MNMSVGEKKLAAHYVANILEDCDPENIGDDLKTCAVSLLDQNEIEEVGKLFRSGKRSRIFAGLSSKSMRRKIKEYMNSNDNSDRLESIINKLVLLLREKAKTRSMLPKIQTLKSIFKLDTAECDILSLAYIVHLDENLSGAMSELSSYRRDSLNGFSKALTVPPRDLLKAVLPDAPLVKNGLLETDFEINRHVAEFLYSSEKSFIRYLCDEGQGPFYDLYSFPTDPKLIDAAVSLIKNVPDARLLIYGPCGTGKTEFAKTLSDVCGRTPYFVKNSDDVYVAIAASVKGKELIIADEADDALNEWKQRGVTKGQINKSMDALNKQCIFISNYVYRIDHSTLRRFHLIIEFKELSKKGRVSMWTSNVADLNDFADEETIARYAKKYNLPLGVVANSAGAAVKCCRPADKQRDFFETLMKSHDNVVNGDRKKTKKKQKDVKVSEKFNIEYLNTDMDISFITGYIKKYIDMAETNKDLRCSLLFHGAPGTGKTEFARYIAKLAGRKSIVLKCSDIKNMWVGEAEKNIKKAFEDAREESAVLIFDEADSMLHKRTGDLRTWERNEVNEFLAQMDEYKGMLICTTNFINSLDDACVRRFDFKLEFKPMTNSQILKALNSYFEGMNFEDNDITPSWRGQLTLGDIAVVFNRVKLMEIDKAGVTASLDAEVRAKQKAAGKDIAEKKNISEMFNSDYLNTDMDILLTTEYVKKYVERVKIENNIRCSLLFHGAPGTGKTEFAKYIAKLAGMESIVLRCSDIKSKGVGDTEKNIKNAFEEARKQSAVLIFDEADSMLHKRTGDLHTRERDEVNEFLAQMDEYKGMLICTTNFIDSLDSACLRRFDFKMEFKPMTNFQILKALNSYFEGMNFEDGDIKPSWIGKLTLGDIAVVSNRVKLLEADKTKTIDFLDAEVRAKQKAGAKTLGF